MFLARQTKPRRDSKQPRPLAGLRNLLEAITTGQSDIILQEHVG